MKSRFAGRLLNFVLFMAIVCLTTIATVFTSHETRAYDTPKEIPKFIPMTPQGSMKALIDLQTGSVLELQSSTPVKDLEVTVNHPEPTNVPAKEPVTNHYYTVTKVMVTDTVYVNPYPVLKFKPLASPDMSRISKTDIPEFDKSLLSTNEP